MYYTKYSLKKNVFSDVPGEKCIIQISVAGCRNCRKILEKVGETSKICFLKEFSMKYRKLKSTVSRAGDVHFRRSFF